MPSSADLSAFADAFSWQRQLAPGEQVIWQGAPRQGLMLQRSDAWMIPFSLMWGGFALFWEWMAVVSNAPWFFVLWGIPFVAIGLYLIVGRFFMDARRRSRTRYALTTERVLLAAGQRRIRSLPLRHLPEMALDENGDGSGTITFGSVAGGGAALRVPPGWPGALGGAARLEALADAGRVFQLIRDAQRRSA